MSICGSGLNGSFSLVSRESKKYFSLTGYCLLADSDFKASLKFCIGSSNSSISINYYNDCISNSPYKCNYGPYRYRNEKLSAHGFTNINRELRPTYFTYYNCRFDIQRLLNQFIFHLIFKL